MKEAKRKSMLKSILWSAVGVLICMNLVVVLLFAAVVSPGMLATSRSEVYYRVAEQSSDMNAWMVKHVALAEDLALTARVNDLRGDALRTYLHECMLNVSPSIMDCYVSWADESPFMICAVFVPADDYVPEERGWYKAAVAANGTTITDPYIDAFTGKIVITVASLIKDELGRRIGCVGLDIDITELVNLTDQMHADENGYAVLVDAAGNVVVDARHPELSHHLEGENEIVTALSDLSPVYTRALSAGQNDLAEGKDVDGMRCFFPVVELGDTGWKLLYAADYDEMRIDSVVYAVLIAGVGVAGMAIGAVFLRFKFTRRLRPLADLEVIVDEMESGVLDHTYPETVNDEVGGICRELKETNAALKSYVDDIASNLSRMASGDFRVKFEAEYVGEFTSIKTSLERISEAMIELIRGVGGAASRVSESAGSVSSTSGQLASGAQEQNNTLDQLTGILEDLVGQIRENSAGATRADSSARRTAKAIQESSGEMEALVRAMDQITDLSRQIERIVSTIDDIAFQTNILALNASVEAARAGTAGKGFAVVADEVRNLAQKSAAAAQDTSQLIHRTTSAIGESTALAHNAAQSLAGVAEDAQQVSALVEDINRISKQQDGEVARIHDSLSELSGIAARNAGTAQESAAASAVLDRQASTLEELLRNYQR